MRNSAVVTVVMLLCACASPGGESGGDATAQFQCSTSGSSDVSVPDQGDQTSFPDNADYCYLMDGCQYEADGRLTLRGLLKNGQGREVGYDITAVLNGEAVASKAVQAEENAVRQWRLVAQVSEKPSGEISCDARVEPS